MTRYQRRPNQEQRLLQVLRQAKGAWVELPTILDLRIAQYSARIHGLRKKGYQIENDDDNKPHTRFRLVSEPAFFKPRSNWMAAATTGNLFPDAPERHLDLG
jgi:hypothetical protein